jgi:hypothetical protein
MVLKMTQTIEIDNAIKTEKFKQKINIKTENEIQELKWELNQKYKPYLDTEKKWKMKQKIKRKLIFSNW